MSDKLQAYTVKFFLGCLVEGPGAGYRAVASIPIRVEAFSQVDARGRAEDALSKALQDLVDDREFS